MVPPPHRQVKAVMASSSRSSALRSVDYQLKEVGSRAPTPEFIFSTLITVLPSFPWVFTFQNTLWHVASLYFILSWQPNISPGVLWEYISSLIVLCHLAKSCLFTTLIQKGINLNYMMLWLSPEERWVLVCLGKVSVWVHLSLPVCVPLSFSLPPPSRHCGTFSLEADLSVFLSLGCSEPVALSQVYLWEAATDGRIYV